MEEYKEDRPEIELIDELPEEMMTTPPIAECKRISMEWK